MSDLRQAALGTAAALLTILIMAGSLFVAMGETGTLTARVNTPAATPAPTSSPPPVVITQLPGDPTFTPSVTSLPTATPTFLAPPTECPPPAGWVPVSVQPGDTLNSLSQVYGVTVEELRQGNCLVVNTLAVDSILYVPPLPPTATATATEPPTPEPTDVPCSPPRSWVTYTVRRGDTLSFLSRVFGVSVAQLQQANCLGSSTRIFTGQSLYVPFPFPITATASHTPPAVPTHTFTPPPMNTVPPPTNTSVPTKPPSPTLTPTAAHTSTPPPANTPVPIPPTPTNTPVPPTATNPPPTPVTETEEPGGTLPGMPPPGQTTEPPPGTDTAP